jgi:hypothetical protein
MGSSNFGSWFVFFGLRPQNGFVGLFAFGALEFPDGLALYGEQFLDIRHSLSFSMTASGLEEGWL